MELIIMIKVWIEDSKYIENKINMKVAIVYKIFSLKLLGKRILSILHLIKNSINIWASYKSSLKEMENHVVLI